jgi:hypothetical protein
LIIRQGGMRGAKGRNLLLELQGQRLGTGSICRACFRLAIEPALVVYVVLVSSLFIVVVLDVWFG